MSKLPQRSFRIRLCLAILLLAFCVISSLLVNRVYRQPLNPVSAVVVVKEEPEFLPEFEDVTFVTASPPPPSSTKRFSEDEPTTPEINPSTVVDGVTDTAVSPTHSPTNLTPQPNQPHSRPFTPTGTAVAHPERVTILMMGSDSRVGALISRTDTMILISVNTVRHTVSILSIPRDLYVEIPGYGWDRLNTALIHGTNVNDNDPVVGMAVAMQTIEQTIGVPIDHYILVNLQAVEDTIDSLGGVDVYVPYTISDPTYINRETGQPLYIPEGLNHFDGNMALRYARTRFQDSDFARANRQQQLLLAIRQKVLSLGLSEMIDLAPLFYQHVKSGIFTDMSLEDMVNLAQVGDEIPEENIRTAVLNKDYVVSGLSPEGSYILYLIPEKVIPLIQEMFHDQDSPQPTPRAEGQRINPKARVQMAATD